MAGEGYRPGFSLAGAVDLSALKHKAEAPMGQEGGAPASGGYVIDVTEANFESVIQSSSTFPILLMGWVADDQRFFDIAQIMADAVSALDGRIQLGRIDAATEPQVIQALRMQSLPAMCALVGGRPIPLMQGMPSEQEIAQIQEVLLPQIVAMAEQSGITGTAPFISGEDDGDRSSADGSLSDPSEPVVPAGHETAFQLAIQGEYEAAAVEYSRLVERDPHDSVAARERAKCLLLVRNGQSDVRVVRSLAADQPDDVEAQLNVADIDMIGGQIEDAFSRLLDFIAQPHHREDIDVVRERLVEYFAIPPADDPRVRRARQRLMTLMY